MIKSTIPNAIRSILKTDGVKGLYRGVVAGGLGAGPAHAVYFATYEYGKKMFRLNPIGSSSSSSSSSAYGEFVADASAGGVSDDCRRRGANAVGYGETEDANAIRRELSERGEGDERGRYRRRQQ